LVKTGCGQASGPVPNTFVPSTQGGLRNHFAGERNTSHRLPDKLYHSIGLKLAQTFIARTGQNSPRRNAVQQGVCKQFVITKTEVLRFCCWFHKHKYHFSVVDFAHRKVEMRSKFLSQTIIDFH
jgi:hypothetical protein